jgi:hypothetical protein
MVVVWTSLVIEDHVGTCDWEKDRQTQPKSWWFQIDQSQNKKKYQPL